jgi:hypothetical protein
MALAVLEKKVAAMDGNLANLALAAAQFDRGAEVRFYRDRPFYEATKRAVENAQSRVFVSWLRYHSPNRMDASRSHIEACRLWALQSPDRRFRRAILQAKGDKIIDFIAGERAAVAAAKAQERSYNARLLTSPIHQSEAISVGLYDDDLVFISYTGDADHVMGFSIKSRELVEKYFDYYYEKLWASAVPIEDCGSSAEVPVLNGTD